MTEKKKKRKYLFIVGIVSLMFLLVPAITGLYLNDLEDVNTDTAISCNLLHYNGTAWTNYDIFNQTITWYKQHTFLDIIHAKSYYGDGGNLTNITASVTLPSYLTSKGHPHNQDLNTTSLPTFTNITLSSLPNWYYRFTHFADWNNITNKPSLVTSKGHPHNQDLNTTSDVTFNDITSNNNIYIPKYYSLLFGNNAIILGLLNEGKIYEIQTGARNIDLVIDNINGDNIGLSTTNNIVYDLKVDTIGAVSIPRQPSCRARLSANQNVPTGAGTKLALATTDYDLNSDFSAVNNRFICPVAGLYQISWSIYCLSLADQNTLYGAIYKNGVVAGGHTLVQQSTATTLALSISGSDILYLNANDYIELYVYHNYPIVTRQFPTLTYSNYLAICKIA